jgi:epoxide hydrolase-like predicted phosphatase
MPRPKIQAVFFDLGGVLVANISGPFFNLAGKLFGVDSKKVGEAWSKNWPALEKGHMPHHACLRKVAAYCGVDRVSRRAIKRLENSYGAFAKIDPAVFKIIRELKKRGVFLGVISNTHAKHSAFNTRRGLFRHFDMLVLSHRVGLAKPDPKIFRLALKRSGFSPRDSLFIDDNPRFVRGAMRVGMKGIVFKNATGLRKRLKKLGVL